MCILINSTFFFFEDSGDEMSSDSLGLAPYEEDSSDEDTKMHRSLTRGRSSEEALRNHATRAEREKDLQTDEQEQLSEPLTVTCFYSPTCLSCLLFV